MDDEDNEAKTENPTEKRLNDAREEGNVPLSREVPTAAVIVAMSVYLTIYGRPNVVEQSAILRSISDFYVGPEELSVSTLVAVLEEVIAKTVLLWAPLYFLIMAASLLGSASQGKLRIVSKRISADYSRISPAAGWKRLASLQNMVEFTKSVVKLIFPIGVFYIYIEDYLLRYNLEILKDSEYVLLYIFEFLKSIFFSMALLCSLIAASDYFWQRFTWWSKLKMSRQQLKDEVKQSEGDPVIKGRLNSIRREKARRRMMRSVQTATLVIANPTHVAVALRYNRDKDPAPVVVATGLNLVALKIREVAEDNQIPVFERVELARGLYKAVKIDQIIPPQFYKAIAEIIRIIYEGNKYCYDNKIIK